MPKLSDTRRLDRQTSLLGAARTVFADQGYENASIASIARLAGVSDGLLYRYFSDKRALLAAVLQQFVAEILTSAETALENVSGFEAKLAALMRANLAVYVREPDMCRLFIREGRDAGDYQGSPLQTQMRRYTNVLRAIVHEAIEAGEAQPWLDERMVRDFIFGGLEHLAWRSLATDQAPDLSARATELAQMLVRGMGR